MVGGANSAGQAALHLSQFASHVTLIVRGPALEAGMSDYLVRQIQVTQNIDVRLRSRIVEGHGTGRLAALELENGEGRHDIIPGTALFVMIGTEARTDWLGPSIRRDGHGFVLTGRDLPPDAGATGRPPLPFETSMPGVFAVGDVRHGSIKRVAEALGEGSVAVGFVHQHLARSQPSAESRVRRRPAPAVARALGAAVDPVEFALPVSGAARESVESADGRPQVPAAVAVDRGVAPSAARSWKHRPAELWSEGIDALADTGNVVPGRWTASQVSAAVGRASRPGGGASANGPNVASRPANDSSFRLPGEHYGRNVCDVSGPFLRSKVG